MRSSSDTPSIAITSVTVGRPSVRVPVLSVIKYLSELSSSSASALFMSIPCSTPSPVPTIIAVGVARPSAQGQEMTRTESAYLTASSPSPRSSQTIAVMTDIAITEGTNTALILSATLAIGAFDAAASSRSAIILACAVSEPIRSSGADAVSHLSLYGNALAREHRFVNRACALDYHRVCGDYLACLYCYFITHR